MELQDVTDFRVPAECRGERPIKKKSRIGYYLVRAVQDWNLEDFPSTHNLNYNEIL